MPKTQRDWLTIGLTGGISAMMIAGTVGHIASPDTYNDMIPSFIDDKFAHGFAVVTELGVATLTLNPKTRRYGALAFAGLMVVFMPIHVLDSLKDQPAIGSTPVAWVRNVAQLGLVYAGFALAKRVAAKNGKRTFEGLLPKR